MADKRAFAQFDVGYLDNPKIMDVFDASCIAICMHFASVLYCAQHLTDGVIALRAMQRKVGASEADSTLLIEAGLWHLPGHDCPECPEVAEGKAYVHDYLQHNRTSDGVKGRSDVARRNAAARWNKVPTDANCNANGMQPASEPQSEPQCENDDLAMLRERERKKEKNLKDTSEPSGPEALVSQRTDVDEIVDYMTTALRDNDVKFTAGKAWSNAARLLLDKDGYTVEQVKYVITFAVNDSFWNPHILSLPKLRVKFETLKKQALQKSGTPKGKPTTTDKMMGTIHLARQMQEQQLAIGAN